MQRTFFILASWGLALISAAPVLAGGNEDEVTLHVRNGAAADIRCLAVLAHFVTEDFDPIAPDASMTMLFDRAPDGNLGRGSFQGKPLWVENVRCGLDKDWTATATDIPLDELRRDTVSGAAAICSGTPQTFGCNITVP